MADRRLPVFLVLDCSGSMSGEPIEAVRQGMRALLSDLRSDPTALETAHLSVIAFSDDVSLVCPLTPLLAFQEPTLSAGGSTAMGRALEFLMERVDAEVARKGPDQRGDYRPLVYLMTDGIPTDAWEAAADRVRDRKLGNLIACAAGPGANTDVLKRVTSSVVRLDDLQPDTLRTFFKWVSDSIKLTSQSIAIDGAGTPVPAPPAPAQIHIIP